MSKVIYTFIIEVEEKTSTSKKFKNFILNFISELNKLNQKISLQKSSEEKFYWTQIVNGLIITNNREGSITNWLFAVDGDSDRQNDEMMSELVTKYIRCDSAGHHFSLYDGSENDCGEYTVFCIN